MPFIALANQQLSNENQNRQEDNKSDDSCNTLISDIPDEEEIKFGNRVGPSNYKFNNFENQILLMKCIQWQKDSHGLFDYDMRQIDQSSYQSRCEKMVIRNGSSIIFDDLGTNIRQKYSNNHQELFNIYKNRNRFFIEGVEPTDRS